MSLPKGFKQEVPLSKYTMANLKAIPKMKFRVLSDFIEGRSVWGEPDGKRVCTRRRIGEDMPVEAIGWSKRYNKPESVKQFIAAIVFNYTTNQVEIFETDKSTVIGFIEGIEGEADWGDSKNYDLIISKSGEDLDTTYSVLPSNKTPFKQEVDIKDINLQVLFDGQDPFAVKE